MTGNLRGRRPKIAALGAVAAGLLGLLAFRYPTDGNPIQAIAEKLSAYYAIVRPEKAYLHLDRPAYGTGETIWFSAYVVDALRHQPDTLSKVLHVELLSPQRRVVARRTLRLSGGRAYGDIELGDTLKSGTYLLRAFTTWMRNVNPAYIFQRQLQVWPAAPNQPDDFGSATPHAPAKATARAAVAAGKVDVQFFPEGGNLVAGLPATVGFKAVAASGRGAAISGQVLDEQNKPVGTAFGAAHAGMGRLSFTPAAGQRYHARLKLPDGSGADYPLPAVQATGYALRVLDAGDSYTVEARYKGAPGAPVPGPAMLLTEVRGYLVGLVPRPLTDTGDPATWKLSKARYPNGILHITLFNAQGVPQAERLAFILNGPPALRVTLTPDKSAYAPHDPVHVKVQVTDAAGQPAAAHLSVTVAEAGAASLDPDGGNVATSLLLTSDLAGYVESPGYYFQTPTPETAQALDNLLLTQGWRRYVWKEVLAPTPPLLVYGAEQDVTLSGQVTGMGQTGIANSQLTFIQSKPNRSVLTASTDAQGLFRFTGFPGKDTAVVTLQARRTSGGSNVIIRPDLGPPTFGAPLPPLPAAPPAVADYLRRSRQQQVQERQNNPDGEVLRNVQLSNVAVTGKKVLVPPDDSRRLYPGVVANTVIDFANDLSAQSGLSIFQVLQGRVAGLTVSGSPPNMSVQIRGSGTPLFILDGQRVDIDFISSIQANQVEAVEVFKGPEAAIFGNGAGGGVIAIYTKRGDKNYKGTDQLAPSPGILTVKVPGYYAAKEFYQPRYGAPVLNAPTMDPRRLTLFWDPQLTTGPNGQTEFLFYTADGSGNFQISTEGITLEGQPSRGSSTIYVAPKSR